MKKKIKDLEKWCKENKNYSYEYWITENNRILFADLHTNSDVIYLDEEAKLKRFLKRNKWRIQYVYWTGEDITYTIARDN